MTDVVRTKLLPIRQMRLRELRFILKAAKVFDLGSLKGLGRR